MLLPACMHLFLVSFCLCSWVEIEPDITEPAGAPINGKRLAAGIRPFPKQTALEDRFTLDYAAASSVLGDEK